MGYTAEELRDLEHPYEDLGTGDALAENMAELNSLSPEDQKSLAARLILACPQSELKAFRSQIEAARTPHDDKQTFHAVLSEAYEIKNRILALLDLRNTKPHQLILGNEFNEKLFHNHRQLAIDVLQDNETSIAERLALTTPPEDRNQLTLNVRGIFPDSVLAAKIGHAFAIRRDIDKLLLGEEPYKFFTSREYNDDACHEFSKLFSVIEKHESSIAAKLALTTPKEDSGQLVLTLEKILPNTLLAAKIGHALAIRRDIDNLLLGEEPHQFFTSPEYNEDACHEFAGLFSAISGHESAIAAKLALRVPKEERSGMLRNIRGLISANDELSRKVSASFELRRTIELTLLGDKPEQFFSRGFSADLCNEYSVLFSTLIKGKEAAIGEKLSQLDEEKRADINRKLEQINGAAHEQSSPFRLIAEAMAPKQDATSSASDEQPKAESVVSSCGTNPNSLFSVSPKQSPRGSLLSKTPITADNTDPDNSNDDGCIKKFCGMFG